MPDVHTTPHAIPRRPVDRTAQFSAVRTSGSRAAGLRFAAVGAVALLVGLAGCTPGDTDAQVVPHAETPQTVSVAATDSTAATTQASAFVYESADVVVLGSDSSAQAVADMARDRGVPGLLGTFDAVEEELDRLGAETVLVPASDDVGGGSNGDSGDSGADDGASDRDSLTFDDDLTIDGTAPQIAESDTESPAVLLLDPAEAGEPGAVVARASVEAAAGTTVEVAGADPRATAETVAAAKETGDGGVFALGAFGDAEVVDQRLDAARTVPELPGGGQIAFPGKRMIAAYGTPGTPSMGILGEQDLDASVDRVKALAADYDDHTEEQVIPAMEIITTVASSVAGADGDYSTEIDPETLRPWVDRAGEEGIYVVLDLQPGTTHFLEQAKLYEDLLLEPHVGLALDPEWRLKPGQRHLAQIGSVSAEEVNEVSTWLADLTRDNGLPQKVFILHQFSLSMISDRGEVDAKREELAIVLHADGNGTPGAKMATYDHLRADLPEGIRMAWKNFYDEDDPTFTPEQTMDVEPTPWFVSYQ